MATEVAVVAGGGGGLGGNVSTDLAKRGVPVVVTGRTQSTLDETVEAVKDAGVQAIALAGNVSDEAHIDKLFALTESTFGPCTVLIHAAATHGTPMRLVDVSTMEWNHVMNTNLFSTFLLLKDLSVMRRATTVEEMGRTAFFLTLGATAMTEQNLVADCGLTA
jgi:NAD(P)-dependent dehydrogenase (short-subunit alcohol dehydrogenase family)